MTALTKLISFFSLTNLGGIVLTWVEGAAVLLLIFLLIERVLMEANGSEELAERHKATHSPTVWMLVIFVVIVALRLFQVFGPVVFR